jgi:hypothetical protein
MKHAAFMSFALVFAATYAHAEPVDAVYAIYGSQDVKVGMSILDMKGEANHVPEFDAERGGVSETRHEYGEGFLVYTLAGLGDTTTVVKITISNLAILLSNGLHVGLSMREVQNQMGKPGRSGVFRERSYFAYYYFSEFEDPNLNLLFFVDRDGSVREIQLILPVIE